MLNKHMKSIKIDQKINTCYRDHNRRLPKKPQALMKFIMTTTGCMSVNPPGRAMNA